MCRCVDAVVYCLELRYGVGNRMVAVGLVVGVMRLCGGIVYCGLIRIMDFSLWFSSCIIIMGL